MVQSLFLNIAMEEQIIALGNQFQLRKAVGWDDFPVSLKIRCDLLKHIFLMLSFMYSIAQENKIRLYKTYFQSWR